ncbi:MAG: hypothetical protein DME20_12630 [Verrucomicrobia bacterium]|nr:MAG: hypothetical protein DME20_12630 [Verrucomicrobiota bacterium]
MRSRATHAVDSGRVRVHITALVTACLLNLIGAAHADLAPAKQSLADGKVARDGIDLFYTIVGTSGDYVLVLSGGPGEDIRSMQGIADELGKKYRCIMWEQRGTGRSKLPRYDSSTINLNAYIEDIEALRKHLHTEKFIVVGNSWGMILGLAYAATHSDGVRTIERKRYRWRWNLIPRITISAFLLPLLRLRESTTSGRNSGPSRLPFFSFKGGKIWQEKRMFVKRTR